MTRSLKKGPYVDQKLFVKVANVQPGKAIKTWARRSQIAPEFVGKKFEVHNGRRFVSLLVTEAMVGHRLGEFVPTRTFKGHGKVTKRVTEKT